MPVMLGFMKRFGLAYNRLKSLIDETEHFIGAPQGAEEFSPSAATATYAALVSASPKNRLIASRTCWSRITR